MSLALLYLLVGLTAFRAQRLVTVDEWPPSLSFRDWLRHRAVVRGTPHPTGEPRGFWGHTYKLFTCHWCLGLWASVVVVVLTHLFVADLLTAEVREPIGVLVLVAAAASTFVGIIGDALE